MIGEPKNGDLDPGAPVEGQGMSDEQRRVGTEEQKKTEESEASKRNS